tara:strand:+ start:54 stop:392 length:339 start_codon:yes stop_codon:yes gene_type:complete
MPIQKTKTQILNKNLIDNLSVSFTGPWKVNVLRLLSLLLGFYLSTNLISNLINTQNNRLLVLLVLLLSIELIVRIRGWFFSKKELPIYWVFIENIRIGTTYAIVLEAYKLGS